MDTTYYHPFDIFFCFNLKKTVKRRVLWKGLYAFFGIESSSVSKKFSLNWSQKQKQTTKANNNKKGKEKCKESLRHGLFYSY